MARLTVRTALLVLSAAAMIALSAGADCAQGCRCILGTMSCANKGLTAVPQGPWPKVRILDLSSNNISDLNALGQHFPALVLLLLRDNGLATLDLGALAGPDAPPRLMVADLSRNAITQVLPPPSTTSSSKLALLFLGSNLISTLHPHTFRNLPLLQGLSLKDNPLEPPKGLPLFAHSRLQSLDLTRVNAKALSASTFSELPNLTELSLEGSGVRNITGLFLRQHALESLYLQANEIAEISAGTFSEKATLIDLNLDDNPLESIEVTSLPMTRGGELRLEQTPLACTCAYEEVARWAAESGITLHASCSQERSITRC